MAETGLDTYEGLKNQIAEHLDRDDLTDQIDTFIDLAESRHRREVRIRQMLEREPLFVRHRYVDPPARLLQVKHLRLLTSPVTVLTELSPFDMTRERHEETGKPEFFTIHQQIEFDRDPDANYRGELIYWRAPEPLGALAAAAPYLAHDERLSTWATLYTDARDRLNAMAIAQQRAGPLVSRVVGRAP